MRNPIQMTLSATPGEFTNDIPCPVQGASWWTIKQCSGNLTMKLKTKQGVIDITRKQGQWGNDVDIKSVQLSSDVASDQVVVFFSDTEEHDNHVIIDNPITGPVMVTIVSPDPVRVAGTIEAGDVQAYPNFKAPVVVGMAQDFGGGAYAMTFLKTTGSRSLSVEMINNRPGFAAGTPGVLSTTQWQGVIIQPLVFADPSDVLVVTSLGSPMPIYDQNGFLLSRTGVIPQGLPNTQFCYIPTQGIEQLEFNSQRGPGSTISFNFGFSGVPFSFLKSYPQPRSVQIAPAIANNNLVAAIPNCTIYLYGWSASSTTGGVAQLIQSNAVAMSPPTTIAANGNFVDRGGEVPAYVVQGTGNGVIVSTSFGDGGISASYGYLAE